MRYKMFLIFMIVALAMGLMAEFAWADDDDDDNGYGGNMKLTEKYIHTYTGGDDGGLAHINYWGLPTDDPDYFNALPPEEQTKAGKINLNVIHAAAFHPTNAALRGCATSTPMKLSWCPGCSSSGMPLSPETRVSPAGPTT